MTTEKKSYVTRKKLLKKYKRVRLSRSERINKRLDYNGYTSGEKTEPNCYRVGNRTIRINKHSAILTQNVLADVHFHTRM